MRSAVDLGLREKFIHASYSVIRGSVLQRYPTDTAKFHAENSSIVLLENPCIRCITSEAGIFDGVISPPWTIRRYVDYSLFGAGKLLVEGCMYAVFFY